MEQSTLQLHVTSTELEQVSSHKLLGVTIDSQLTFDQHVKNLCTKLSQKIAVLRKIGRFLLWPSAVLCSHKIDIIKDPEFSEATACEYSRFSFAPATTCETRRETSAIHRQKFHTDDVNLPALKWHN